MSLNIKLNKIINFLKISYKNKNVLVKYKKNQLLLNILENFVNENVINGFYEEGDYYYIYLKYNNLGEPVIKDIKMFYKHPFNLTFTLDQLKSTYFIKNYIYRSGEKTSFYLFSTHKGILSYKNCLINNVGGVLLLLIKCV